MKKFLWLSSLAFAINDFELKRQYLLIFILSLKYPLVLVFLLPFMLFFLLLLDFTSKVADRDNNKPNQENCPKAIQPRILSHLLVNPNLW